jgi:hypothetical protein
VRVKAFRLRIFYRVVPVAIPVVYASGIGARASRSCRLPLMSCMVSGALTYVLEMRPSSHRGLQVQVAQNKFSAQLPIRPGRI